MTTIGIFACTNTSEIIEALLLLLKNDRNTVALKSYYDESEADFEFYNYSEADYVLIPFSRNHIYPVTLDILILDNPDNKRIVTYDLIKCIDENTILIYNTDNGYLPKLEHPNAIDYGFSQTSTVSISSIEYLGSSSYSFIISVQENFKCLNGGIYPVGEILINCSSDIKIENRIPAVICGLVCDARERNEIKI